MDILLYSNDLELMEDIDVFNSFIWATRYNTEGDFELRLPLTDKYTKLFKLSIEDDLFIDYKNSGHLMVVEDVDIIDGSDEREIVITGRSLLSLFDRGFTIVKNLENVKISNSSKLKETIINILSSSTASAAGLGYPFGERGRYLRLGSSSLNTLNNSKIDDADFSNPYTFKDIFGATVLNVVKDVLEFFKIGIKSYIGDHGEFIFELYTGDNYTYEQSINPPVLFSERLQNIFSSTSTNTIRNFKNVGMVVGNDEPKSIVFCTLPGTNTKNIREVMLKPSDISKPKDMSTEDYKKMLKEKGMIELKKLAYKTIYDGKIDHNNSLSPIKLGDKVVREDLFGTYQNVQCTEIITSITREGIEVIPSFINI